MAIICRKHKLLFIMVPGTGCSVIGNALQKKLGGGFFPEQPLRHDGRTVVARKHNTLPELIEHGLLGKEEQAEYLVFASVRNPFDRWVTYYQRYVGDWINDYERFSRRQIERDRKNFGLSEEEVQRRLKQHERRFRNLRWRQKIIRGLGFNAWMTGTLLRWAWDNSKGERGEISEYAFPMLEGVDAVIRQERLNEGLNSLLQCADVDHQIDLPRRNTTRGKKPYTEYYSQFTRFLAETLLGEEMKTLGYEFSGVRENASLVVELDADVKEKVLH